MKNKNYVPYYATKPPLTSENDTPMKVFSLLNEYYVGRIRVGHLISDELLATCSGMKKLETLEVMQKHLLSDTHVGKKYRKLITGICETVKDMLINTYIWLK